MRAELLHKHLSKRPSQEDLLSRNILHDGTDGQGASLLATRQRQLKTCVACAVFVRMLDWWHAQSLQRNPYCARCLLNFTEVSRHLSRRPSQEDLFSRNILHGRSRGTFSAASLALSSVHHHDNQIPTTNTNKIVYLFGRRTFPHHHRHFSCLFGVNVARPQAASIAACYH